MKLLDVRPLAIPEVLVVRFGRFADHRGYFTEHFRKSDFADHELMQPLGNPQFVQANESFSRVGTVRGLHFQWNPYVGKLVRTVRGRMVDMVMDIRQGSPTYGKLIAYDMPATPELDFGEWIWVPPGFAHGNYFPEETQIEYFCTGEYNPTCEAGISPLAEDIDWSLCDPTLKQLFDTLVPNSDNISDKDRAGLSVTQWSADPRAKHFPYPMG